MQSFGKRKINSINPIDSRRKFNSEFSSKKLNIENNKFTKTSNYDDIHFNNNNNYNNNNLQKKNSDYFYNNNQNTNTSHSRETENLGFVGNRSRRTLDDNDFRRSNLVRINSRFSNNFNNNDYNYNNHNRNFDNFDLRNPRNTFAANVNSFENLNRNFNFANERCLDNVPDKTPYFANNNNNNYNNSNDNDWFSNRLDYAYVNKNNNENNYNNFNSNALAKKYSMNKDSQSLQNSASQIKKKNKYSEKDNS